MFDIDITLYDLPCLLVSIDYMDSVGNHIMNVREMINFVRLDKDGNKLGNIDVTANVENVKKALLDGE